MPTIVIQGTVIDFPDSAQSPNWAPPVIEFAQAVEQAVLSAIGTFDVPPQILVIDANNPGTDITIPNLNFPTSDVQGARVEIVTYRTTSTETAYSKHNIDLVYNANNPVNNKWEIAQERIGDGLISFSITDAGQMRFTTTAMGGINHTGKITFYARTFQNS